ncbi:Crp/Fnr family transcriptional regulator [Teichococcus vastitatis]|uniref:Crp/Fnr family transcriptional regulator n=1 Tax=Teichococcus vastitatis TaxID=2307076 RepID=UPI000E71EF40|nr:Crp/Fnr family transcriptional regulator [Pseudoroseomonas vastitatis]
MIPTAHAPSAPRNRLLAALPAEDLAKLWPQLTLVELAFRDVLHAAEQPIDQVYFPETGYASILAYMEDGDTAEVAQIGPEGMIGLPVLLEDDRGDLEAMVQNPGTALQMNRVAFRQALASVPAFRSLLLRYALMHHEQMARTGACNGRHGLQQRLARWLLMTHDRAEGGSFRMTQEFLAMMLGVRRAGISVAAGTLQKAGLIHYERRQITVTDRPGLEAAACRCYGIVRRASDRFHEQHIGPSRLACSGSVRSAEG